MIKSEQILVVGKNRNWDLYIFNLLYNQSLIVSYLSVFTAVWLLPCDSWMEELDANVLLQLADPLVSVRQGSRMMNSSGLMNFNVLCSHSAARKV